jgi:hypothetical protein
MTNPKRKIECHGIVRNHYYTFVYKDQSTMCTSKKSIRETQ